MPITISCPQCQRTLRVPDTLIGQRGKCPTCQHMFDIVDPGIQPGAAAGNPAPAPAPPPSAPAAGYRLAPEAPPNYPDARYPAASRPVYDDRGYDRRGYDDRYEGPRQPQGIADLTDQYTIDFGEAWSTGMQSYGNVLGPMIGYMAIYFVIVLALNCVPYLGPFIRFFLDPALLAGFPLVCLAELRRKNWSFGDFFAGFQYYGWLLLNQLMFVVLYIGCFLPVIAVVVLMVIMQEQQLQAQGAGGGPRRAGANEPPIALLIALGITGLLGFCVFMYFYTRCFLFNIYLIIDRGCGPIEAIQGTWTLTRGHFWGWLGVSIVLGLVAFAGFLACGVGALFTVPIYYLVMAAAYLRATSRTAPVAETYG